MGEVKEIRDRPASPALRPRRPTPSERGEARPTVGAKRGEGLRVLWIDDDLAGLHYAIRWLTSQGFSVSTASDGKAGLDLTRQSQFDVIVLDERLPGMTGLELLKTVNSERPETPVMMLTAFGNARFGAEATRLGAAACYDKPLVGDDLVKAVRTVTRKHGWRELEPPEYARLERTTDSIRRLLDCCERFRESSQAVGPPFVGTDGVKLCLKPLIASVLVDPGIGFVEFCAAARALRLLAPSLDPPGRIAADVKRNMDHAVRSRHRCEDPVIAWVLSRLASAGAQWPRLRQCVVATELNLHRASLHRLLQASLGLGFRRCVLTYVIRLAVQELATSDEQVAQIAYRLGYEEPRFLNRHFRTILGTSPTEFRSVVNDR